MRDTAALWQELLTVQQLPRDERRGLGSFETEKPTRKTRKIHKKEFQSEAENSHGHQAMFRKPRQTQTEAEMYSKNQKIDKNPRSREIAVVFQLPTCAGWCVSIFFMKLETLRGCSDIFASVVCGVSRQDLYLWNCRRIGHSPARR